jgi:hypothetical protein
MKEFSVLFPILTTVKLLLPTDKLFELSFVANWRSFGIGKNSLLLFEQAEQLFACTVDIIATALVLLAKIVSCNNI